VRPKSAASCSNLAVAVCDSDLLPFERVTQGRHQDLQESVYCRLSHRKRSLARVRDFFLVTSVRSCLGFLLSMTNAPIRYLMRFYLERAGYVVCGEAKGGVEGIEEAKRTQPDVILLDLTMPEMTGTETAAVLKRVLPQIPIIVFTLHEDSVNAELAATMGVDLVVNKMEGIPKLAESVRALLGRSTPVSSGLSSESQQSIPKNKKAEC
jgi:CheY-like chemotaxis protein